MLKAQLNKLRLTKFASFTPEFTWGKHKSTKIGLLLALCNLFLFFYCLISPILFIVTFKCLRRAKSRLQRKILQAHKTSRMFIHTNSTVLKNCNKPTSRKTNQKFHTYHAYNNRDVILVFFVSVKRKRHETVEDQSTYFVVNSI